MQNNQSTSQQIHLNQRVIQHFTQVKYWFLIPPLLILLFCYFYFILFNEGGHYVDEYVNLQKELFINLNSMLSKFPRWQENLTQLGDAAISLPLLSLFILYAPKLWEAILASAIISGIASSTLKAAFSMPRPAAMLDHDSFVIIGKALSGHSSLPSGHSIAGFAVISLVLLAFMPQKNQYKIIWSTFILVIGLFIVFSRVGVGAHYPLDVVIGSAIGYISSVIGIKITSKKVYLPWLENKKYYPILMLFFAIWIYFIIQEMRETHLPILYLSLLSLAITIILLFISYAKNKH